MEREFRDRKILMFVFIASFLQNRTGVASEGRGTWWGHGALRGDSLGLSSLLGGRRAPDENN